MKKLIAILLTLVLMFSFSVTALAAGETAGNATSISGTGTTVVSLLVDSNGQVSATVPLTVTLAVAASGDVTGPNGYTITNTSVMPIKVSKVTITPISGFVTTNETGTKIGTITLTDGQGGAATALSAWVAEKTATAWNMATGGVITLNFDGTVTGITQDITTATAAFEVVFTIVAGAHTGT